MKVNKDTYDKFNTVPKSDDGVVKAIEKLSGSIPKPSNNSDIIEFIKKNNELISQLIGRLNAQTQNPNITVEANQDGVISAINELKNLLSQVESKEEKTPIEYNVKVTKRQDFTNYIQDVKITPIYK